MRAREVAFAFLVLSGSLGSVARAQPLPPVPVPAQNPITEAKRVLGKMLFWDEQLSSDSTMACATCHSPGEGGTDVRRVRIPGFDGLVNTPDDVFGSPGVISADGLDNYLKVTFFGLAPQVTGRTAQSYLTAAYSPQTFWDGRGSGTFRDPITNAVLIPNGGALESQAVGPILNTTEMAHQGRDWAQVSAKLQNARPMALATGLQADVAAAIAPSSTYGDLFATAFGNAQVTPARIAFAIATYERTLYPNDTPFDRTQLGQPGGMTPQQQQGFGAFQASNCNLCHGAPQFTGNGFRNIGLRPPQEDLGQQLTTGNAADRGKFKVPSLRNVGLRESFMHNGQFTSLTTLIQFYARAPGAAPQFADNQDPLMLQVNVPPPAAGAIQAFLTGALTDARVQNQTFPFDRATLWSDRAADRVAILAGGSTGTGGAVPLMIAARPALVGNADFALGVQNALGGASARLVLSTKAPVGGLISADQTFGPITLIGTGATNGYGTIHWPIPANGSLLGQSYYFQWVIDDPAAAGGAARSAPARATFFCAGEGCAAVCFADIDDGSSAGIPDGSADINDLLFFLAEFEDGTLAVDLDNGSFSGVKDLAVDISDLLFFLERFEQGC